MHLHGFLLEGVSLTDDALILCIGGKEKGTITVDSRCPHCAQLCSTRRDDTGNGNANSTVDSFRILGHHINKHKIVV